MANTTYQVSLSTDGHHTVTVTGDDAKELRAVLAWAKAMHAALVAQNSIGSGAATEAEMDAPDGAAPVCAVHQVPLVRMTGKRGPFWSCHQKQDDGRFCTYRPPTAA